ncbi:MAG: M23 family metallopeptidase [Myxococcota bacterium]|nr:M23 family metallopeptidase [Myxococcota bacterium]
MRGFQALLCLPWVLCASGASAASDAEILLLIDTLRPTAEAISVDGDLSDWGTIPFFSDPTGDAGGNPALDISSVAVAPLLDGLLFGVETVGALPALGSFVVEADFADGPRLDFRIELDPVSGIHAFTSYDAFGQPQSSTTITGLNLAVGAQAIEIEIPYSALGAVLPSSLAAALNPAVHRSWVRVQVSNENVPGIPLDKSPSIASYRLLETPYPLDSPLPKGILNASVAPIELSFPLEGRWFLGQGANGSVTHQGSWSYDFALLDDKFDQSNPPLSTNNADYFGFGEPFFAPASGTVTVAIGSNPDQTPFMPGFVNNEVQISLSSGHSVRLLHAKQGTTLVSVGQVVDPSVQIAEVGNAGFSFQTHLHIDVIDVNGTHPLAFLNMDIALNPIDDPWLRHLESWEPRVGLFTTIPEPSAPLMELAALLAIAFIGRQNNRAEEQGG